jgi:23S rRNA (pseudouridine1915-N3)-methyltransferase
MKDLHLIVIGKLKNKNLLGLESEYLKRIKSPKIHIHECKSFQEDIHLEEKELKNKVNQIETKFGKQKVFVLTEHGKTLSSVQLSQKVFQTLENDQCGICFLIGGAAGFTKEFIKNSDYQLSLSPMTFPHKIARLVFIEQIYRAETIQQGHPYHKD